MINNDLLYKLENGTFTHEDARVYFMNQERDLILQKYNFTNIKKAPSDGRYHIKIKNKESEFYRKSLAANTIEELMEMVYQHEIGNCKVIKELMTFEDAFMRSLEEKIKFCKNKDRLPSVKNTVNRYKGDYAKYVEPTPIAHMPVKYITKQHVEQVLDSAIIKYKLKKTGFNNIKIVIRHALKYAYSIGLVDEVVIDRISNDRYKNSFEDDVDLNDRMHSDEEINRLLEGIKEKHATDPAYIPAYALELQIFSELRRGEIPPLRWSDVHMGEHFFTICREQITQKSEKKGMPEEHVIVNRTKNGKSRNLPIYSAVAPIFAKLWEVHIKYYPNSEYVFPDLNTKNGCITNNVVYRFYYRLCKKQGIELSREFVKGTHSFRKTLSTKIAESFGVEIASQIAGNTPAVLNKNYNAGISLDRKYEILEAINGIAVNCDYSDENLYPKEDDLYPQNVVIFRQKKSRKH